MISGILFGIGLVIGWLMVQFIITFLDDVI